MSDQKLTYKSSGVNYDLLDKLKRLAQIAGKDTFKNIIGTGFSEDPDSQGESAFIVRQGNILFAFVQEGLGTKNLVADAVEKITGKSYYSSIAQDTVAMIINDLITVGARPLSIMAYWGIGSEEWLKKEGNMETLVEGWRKACQLSGVAWVGGETPMLSGVINPETIDLAGAAFGIVDPQERLSLGKNLKAGDAIILFESSGIHANGVSLARKLVEQLSDRYATKLSSGRMYGEALLDPTIIYAKLIQDLFSSGVGIHYMANITGHGWRKLMRHKKELTYRIKEVPPVPEVLSFIQKEADMEVSEAYATFNMGAGFAIYVPQEHVQTVLEIAQKNNIKAYNAGVVEAGEKQVIIEPLGITYSAETLQVRV